MNDMSLKDIEIEVNKLAKVIRAPGDELPTYGYSRDFAYPHIEVDDHGYHYVVIERGQERERKTTQDVDELLYWIFDSVTFSMALKYELRHRIRKKDSRRMHFEKQEELLGKLHPEWEEKAKEEHLSILKEHPFDDLAGVRATYCGKLRKKGLSESEIDRIACEKYPMSK
ncbi:MAG TPA: Imm63 family immunity protein [Spirochaetota bacterium]